MTKYKLYAAFFSVIIVGLIVIGLISSGYYPIAVVNWHFITAKDFANDYAAASVYYKNAFKVYGNSSSTAATLTSSEIQQSVLTGMIEDVLIDSAARKEIGSNLDNLVNEKVNQATNVSGLENAVKTVYGLDLNDFKNEILVPQAERDILTGSLLLKGQKIDDWLSQRKKESSVLILSGKFYWDGQNVVSK